MSKGSLVRQMKRKVIREGGVTFSERVRRSIAKGKSIGVVTFKREGKKIVAVEQ